MRMKERELDPIDWTFQIGRLHKSNAGEVSVDD